VDLDAAETLLRRLAEHIPADNSLLRAAHQELTRVIHDGADRRDAFWRSLLHHEWEPWEEWFKLEEVDLASLLFLARNCLRPSIEWGARGLTERFPIPADWLRGYCPVCGSLPSLLLLEGEGERMACCSWCGAQWPLLRFQCPNCDNRDHSTLGYLYIEAEPHYHIQYCQACSTYFKQIDGRERLYPPFPPLEELITLHLDLLAQRAGYLQAPSISSVVYGQSP
jgi:FdhE protein